MKKNNIIFMVNLWEEKKPNRTLPYEFSQKSWKAYADRTGSSFFVLKYRIYKEEYMNANWHKIFVFELLDSNEVDYDKILIVDADTLIHPDSPDIFEVGKAGSFNAAHNSGSYDWLFRSMEIYSKYLFDGFWFDFTNYFNSGVILLDKTLKSFYDEIITFYHRNHDKIKELQNRFGVGTDQPVLNFLVHKNKIPFELLEYEWNMQELPRREILDKELTFTNFGWIYHFNGINPHSSVEDWMRYTHQKLNKNNEK